MIALFAASQSPDALVQYWKVSKTKIHLSLPKAKVVQFFCIFSELELQIKLLPPPLLLSNGRIYAAGIYVSIII
jgi:hypothetical protein